VLPSAEATPGLPDDAASTKRYDFRPVQPSPGEKTLDVRPHQETIRDTASRTERLDFGDPPADLASTIGYDPSGYDPSGYDAPGYDPSEDRTEPMSGPQGKRPTPRRPGAKKEHVGRFRVLGVLGSGSFGTVYRAYDPVLDREVALKVPRFVEDDPALPERFLREAKAAARLRHPNIVAIFESGQADGSPYIACEFVDGVPLSQHLREKPVDPQTAVEWARQIAEALDYAHGEGIVHRDIKPANIMVNRAGRPQVMDFGLAKSAADEAARMSIEGQIIGTPAYMAPEQARGSLTEVGPRSDQYSVGVVLYEMLCGRTPFVGDPWSVMSCLTTMDAAPPAPRSLRADLPRDLEACCLKALEKEPAARYPSLQALADDLKRWLEGRPLVARPIGIRERLTRWCRKNRTIAVLGGVLGIVFVAAAIVGPILAFRFRELAATATREAEDATKAREQEKAARLATEQLLIDTYTEAGLAADRNGDAREAILWFTSAAARSAQHPLRDRHNRLRFHSWLSEVAIPVHAFETPGTWNRALRYHSSGRYLMAEVTGAVCEVRDLRDGSMVPLPVAMPVHSTAWSPDGQMLVLASDRTVAVFEFPGGKEIDRWLHPDKVQCLAFSPDSKLLAIGGERTAQVRGLRQKSLTTPALGHPSRILSIAMSTDGSRLATRGADQFVRVYARGGTPLAESAWTPTLPPQPASFAAEGKEVAPLFLTGNRLIIVDSGNRITCWDTDKAQQLWQRKTGRVLAAAVSRDSRLLALGENFDAVVLDATSGKQVGKPLAHRNLVYDVAFDPTGTVLLAASGDSVRVSSATSGERVVGVVPHNGNMHRCVWSPDGATFATVPWSDQLVRVWKLGRSRAKDFELPLTARHAFVKLSDDGKYLLPCGFDTVRGARELQVHDAATGAPVGKRLPMPGFISDGTFVPGTSLVVTVGAAGGPTSDADVHNQNLDAPGIVRWLDRKTGRAAFPDVLTASQPVAVQASPDGRTVIALCQCGQLLVLDAGTGKLHREHRAFHGVKADRGYVIRSRIRFSPHGDRFAIWGSAVNVEMRQAATGDLLFAVRHAPNFVHDVVFAPDGSRFATCSSDMTARLWQTADGKSAGPDLPHSGWVFSAQFSGDGKRLLTASADRQARIWDLRSGKVLVTTPAQSDEVFGVSYLPGEELFLIATRDGQISVWETTLGKMVAPVRRLPDMVYQLALTKNGAHVVAAGRIDPMHAFDINEWIRPPDTRLPHDELRLLGEILSNQRVHDGGAATSLSRDQWFERWREFRSRFPDHGVLRVPGSLER
jgi:eukaryotic-like serine/threonine-protein kinase